MPKGSPDFKSGDKVTFQTCLDGDGKALDVVGEVWVVDRDGTFANPHEACYDIYSEDLNICFKHIPESSVEPFRE